jgi:hypothetical protein
MPDAWRCECGYTNLGSKTCTVCRRPRQAVAPPAPEARIDDPPPPPPAPVERAAAKRPLKARPAKKAAPRKRTK